MTSLWRRVSVGMLYIYLFINPMACIFQTHLFQMISHALPVKLVLVQCPLIRSQQNTAEGNGLVLWGNRHLSQYWPRCMSPYGRVTGPQWVLLLINGQHSLDVKHLFGDCHIRYYRHTNISDTLWSIRYTMYYGMTLWFYWVWGLLCVSAICIYRVNNTQWLSQTILNQVVLAGVKSS